MYERLCHRNYKINHRTAIHLPKSTIRVCRHLKVVSSGLFYCISLKCQAFENRSELEGDFVMNIFVQVHMIKGRIIK